LCHRLCVIDFPLQILWQIQVGRIRAKFEEPAQHAPVVAPSIGRLSNKGIVYAKLPCNIRVTYTVYVKGFLYAPWFA
jgi:hypothetical protein